MQPLLSREMILSGLVLMASGFIINAIRNVPLRVWNLILRHCTTTIEIPDYDESFNYVRNYLAKHKFIGGLRYVNVYHKNDKFIYSPAPGTHWFFYKGKLAHIHRHRRELEGSTSDRAIYENFSVKMFTRNFELLIEYLDEAKNSYVVRKDVIEIRCADGWGNWNNTISFSKRPLESVILPNNHLKIITDCITNFYGAESRYRELGIPYKMGVLCAGVPGSGKTSLIKALASHFDRKVYILPLSSKSLSDNHLIALLSYVDKGSFIIIEDIDCLFKAREITAENEVVSQGVTFSGLLNAIDGIASPEGNILFMTTNHREVLDAALIRPGRIDLQLEFHNADKSQLERLFQRFYPEVGEDKKKEFIDSVEVNYVNGISMAKAQELLLTKPFGV